MSRKSAFDLDSAIAKIAEYTDKSPAEILAEVEAIQEKGGFSDIGAINHWKSNNSISFSIGVAPRFIRVLKVQPERTGVKKGSKGGTYRAQNIHVAVFDEEDNFNLGGIALYDERIDDPELNIFEVGQAYSLESKMSSGGALTWVTNVQPLEDNNLVPDIFELEGVPILELEDSVGDNEFVHGWVSKLIGEAPQYSGFEIDDETSVLPLTVWFAGEYTKLTDEEIYFIQNSLEIDEEVVVYGYITKKGELQYSLSAENVFFSE